MERRASGIIKLVTQGVEVAAGVRQLEATEEARAGLHAHCSRTEMLTEACYVGMCIQPMPSLHEYIEFVIRGICFDLYQLRHHMQGVYVWLKSSQGCDSHPQSLRDTFFLLQSRVPDFVYGVMV